MSKVLVRSLLSTSLLFAAACTSGVIEGDPSDSVPQVDGLVIDLADPAVGIDATFRAGDTVLHLHSAVVGDVVVSTITQDGVVLTALEVPAGTDRDVGERLGGLVRAASSTPVAGVDYIQLAPHYSEALQQLFDQTDGFGRSTLRFALMWHEEVLIRVLPNPEAETASVDLAWDDTIYTLDDDPEMPLHTNFMVAPHLRTYRASPGEGLRCNLNCRWYDVCCWHDQACVNCDRWYCGPTCVRGCFGGDCGGGR